MVRALNANFRLGDAPRAQAIANYALNEKATPEMRAEALRQLGLWGKVPQRDRVVGIYRPMKERPADDAVAAFAPAVAKLLDGSAPESVQLAAIEAVGSLEMRTAASDARRARGEQQGRRGGAYRRAEGARCPGRR